MKKTFFVFVLILFACMVYGQDYNLGNGIILNEQNKNYGLVITFDENGSDIRSAWDRGTVKRYSNNENNSTNLGKFVEIEYEMGFNFGGSFMSQGKMTIIFSNLTEITITEKTIISSGTLIGRTNEVRIFILSETDNLQFLKTWTNDRKIKVGDYWYWDASFLLR